MATYGTRDYSRQHQINPPTGSLNHSYNSDAGMSKLVNGLSLTFSSSGVAGANGTFSAFAVGDSIEVIGSTLNSGFWLVTAVDAANASFLTLAGLPKAEIATVVLRTP